MTGEPSWLMLPGAPSQLLPAVSLLAVLNLARPGELLGAWLRASRSRLTLRSGRRALIVSADLGALLTRCASIAVRRDTSIVVLQAECLIAWRTLRIVIGTPFLPGLERLRALYPGVDIVKGSAAFHIGLDPPEEALAACMSAGVRVLSSRVEYYC